MLKKEVITTLTQLKNLAKKMETIQFLWTGYDLIGPENWLVKPGGAVGIS